MDFDVLSSQISGAHDVHGELGVVAGEDVEDSVLLDVEGSLDDSHWHRSSGSGDLLKFSVELQEIPELDEVPGSGHRIAVGYDALVRIGGKRMIGWVALDHGIAVPGVAVHPVGPIVGIELGGGHGGREEAEEDQPRKSMLKSVLSRGLFGFLLSGDDRMTI